MMDPPPVPRVVKEEQLSRSTAAALQRLTAAATLYTGLRLDERALLLSLWISARCQPARFLYAFSWHALSACPTHRQLDVVALLFPALQLSTAAWHSQVTPEDVIAAAPSVAVHATGSAAAAKSAPASSRHSTNSATGAPVFASTAPTPFARTPGTTWFATALLPLLTLLHVLCEPLAEIFTPVQPAGHTAQQSRGADTVPPSSLLQFAAVLRRALAVALTSPMLRQLLATPSDAAWVAKALVAAIQRRQVTGERPSTNPNMSAVYVPSMGNPAAAESGTWGTRSGDWSFTTSVELSISLTSRAFMVGAQPSLGDPILVDPGAIASNKSPSASIAPLMSSGSHFARGLAAAAAAPGDLNNAASHYNQHYNPIAATERPVNPWCARQAVAASGSAQPQSVATTADIPPLTPTDERTLQTFLHRALAAVAVLLAHETAIGAEAAERNQRSGTADLGPVSSGTATSAGMPPPKSLGSTPSGAASVASPSRATPGALKQGVFSVSGSLSQSSATLPSPRLSFVAKATGGAPGAPAHRGTNIACVLNIVEAFLSPGYAVRCPACTAVVGGAEPPLQGEADGSAAAKEMAETLDGAARRCIDALSHPSVPPGGSDGDSNVLFPQLTDIVNVADIASLHFLRVYTSAEGDRLLFPAPLRPSDTVTAALVADDRRNRAATITDLLADALGHRSSTLSDDAAVVLDTSSASASGQLSMLTCSRLLLATVSTDREASPSKNLSAPSAGSRAPAPLPPPAPGAFASDRGHEGSHAPSKAALHKDDLPAPAGAAHLQPTASGGRRGSNGGRTVGSVPPSAVPQSTVPVRTLLCNESVVDRLSVELRLRLCWPSGATLSARHANALAELAVAFAATTIAIPLDWANANTRTRYLATVGALVDSPPPGGEADDATLLARHDEVQQWLLNPKWTAFDALSAAMHNVAQFPTADFFFGDGTHHTFDLYLLTAGTSLGDVFSNNLQHAAALAASLAASVVSDPTGRSHESSFSVDAVSLMSDQPSDTHGQWLGWAFERLWAARLATMKLLVATGIGASQRPEAQLAMGIASRTYEPGAAELTVAKLLSGPGFSAVPWFNFRSGKVDPLTAASPSTANADPNAPSGSLGLAIGPMGPGGGVSPLHGGGVAAAALCEPVSVILTAQATLHALPRCTKSLVRLWRSLGAIIAEDAKIMQLGQAPFDYLRTAVSEAVEMVYRRLNESTAALTVAPTVAEYPARFHARSRGVRARLDRELRLERGGIAALLGLSGLGDRSSVAMSYSADQIVFGSSTVRGTPGGAPQTRPIAVAAENVRAALAGAAANVLGLLELAAGVPASGSLPGAFDAEWRAMFTAASKALFSVSMPKHMAATASTFGGLLGGPSPNRPKPKASPVRNAVDGDPLSGEAAPAALVAMAAGPQSEASSRRSAIQTAGASSGGGPRHSPSLQGLQPPSATQLAERRLSEISDALSPLTLGVLRRFADLWIAAPRPQVQSTSDAFLEDALNKMSAKAGSPTTALSHTSKSGPGATVTTLYQGRAHAATAVAAMLFATLRLPLAFWEPRLRSIAHFMMALEIHSVHALQHLVPVLCASLTEGATPATAQLYSGATDLLVKLTDSLKRVLSTPIGIEADLDLAQSAASHLGLRRSRTIERCFSTALEYGHAALAPRILSRTPRTIATLYVAAATLMEKVHDALTLSGGHMITRVTEDGATAGQGRPGASASGADTPKRLTCPVLPTEAELEASTTLSFDGEDDPLQCHALLAGFIRAATLNGITPAQYGTVLLELVNAMARGGGVVPEGSVPSDRLAAALIRSADRVAVAAQATVARCVRVVAPGTIRRSLGGLDADAVRLLLSPIIPHATRRDADEIIDLLMQISTATADASPALGTGGTSKSNPATKKAQQAAISLAEHGLFPCDYSSLVAAVVVAVTERDARDEAAADSGGGGGGGAKDDAEGAQATTSKISTHAALVGIALATQLDRVAAVVQVLDRHVVSRGPFSSGASTTPRGASASASASMGTSVSQPVPTKHRRLVTALNSPTFAIALSLLHPQRTIDDPAVRALFERRWWHDFESRLGESNRHATVDIFATEFHMKLAGAGLPDTFAVAVFQALLRAIMNADANIAETLVDQARERVRERSLTEAGSADNNRNAEVHRSTSFTWSTSSLLPHSKATPAAAAVTPRAVLSTAAPLLPVHSQRDLDSLLLSHAELFAAVDASAEWRRTALESGREPPRPVAGTAEDMALAQWAIFIGCAVATRVRAVPVVRPDALRIADPVIAPHGLDGAEAAAVRGILGKGPRRLAGVCAALETLHQFHVSPAFVNTNNNKSLSASRSGAGGGGRVGDATRAPHRAEVAYAKALFVSTVPPRHQQRSRQEGESDDDSMEGEGAVMFAVNRVVQNIAAPGAPTPVDVALCGRVTLDAKTFDGVRLQTIGVDLVDAFSAVLAAAASTSNGALTGRTCFDTSAVVAPLDRVIHALTMLGLHFHDCYAFLITLGESLRTSIASSSPAGAPPEHPIRSASLPSLEVEAVQLLKSRALALGGLATPMTWQSTTQSHAAGAHRANHSASSDTVTSGAETTASMDGPEASLAWLKAALFVHAAVQRRALHHTQKESGDERARGAWSPAIVAKVELAASAALQPLRTTLARVALAIASSTIDGTTTAASDVNYHRHGGDASAALVGASVLEHVLQGQHPSTEAIAAFRAHVLPVVEGARGTATPSQAAADGATERHGAADTVWAVLHSVAVAASATLNSRLSESVAAAMCVVLHRLASQLTSALRPNLVHAVASFATLRGLSQAQLAPAFSAPAPLVAEAARAAAAGTAARPHGPPPPSAGTLRGIFGPLTPGAVLAAMIASAAIGKPLVKRFPTEELPAPIPAVACVLVDAGPDAGTFAEGDGLSGGAPGTFNAVPLVTISGSNRHLGDEDTESTVTPPDDMDDSVASIERDVEIANADASALDVWALTGFAHVLIAAATSAFQDHHQLARQPPAVRTAAARSQLGGGTSSFAQSTSGASLSFAWEGAPGSPVVAPARDVESSEDSSGSRYDAVVHNFFSLAVQRGFDLTRRGPILLRRLESVLTAAVGNAYKLVSEPSNASPTSALMAAQVAVVIAHVRADLECFAVRLPILARPSTSSTFDRSAEAGAAPPSEPLFDSKGRGHVFKTLCATFAAVADCIKSDSRDAALLHGVSLRAATTVASVAATEHCHLPRPAHLSVPLATALAMVFGLRPPNGRSATTTTTGKRDTPQPSGSLAASTASGSSLILADVMIASLRAVAFTAMTLQCEVDRDDAARAAAKGGLSAVMARLRLAEAARALEFYRALTSSSVAAIVAALKPGLVVVASPRPLLVAILRVTVAELQWRISDEHCSPPWFTAFAASHCVASDAAAELQSAFVKLWAPRISSAVSMLLHSGALCGASLAVMNRELKMVHMRDSTSQQLSSLPIPDTTTSGGGAGPAPVDADIDDDTGNDGLHAHVHSLAEMLLTAAARVRLAADRMPEPHHHHGQHQQQQQYSGKRGSGVNRAAAAVGFDDQGESMVRSALFTLVPIGELRTGTSTPASSSRRRSVSSVEHNQQASRIAHAIRQEVVTMTEHFSSVEDVLAVACAVAALPGSALEPYRRIYNSLLNASATAASAADNPHLTVAAVVDALASAGERRLPPTSYGTIMAELAYGADSIADFCALDYSTALDLVDGVVRDAGAWIPKMHLVSDASVNHDLSITDHRGHGGNSDDDDDDDEDGYHTPSGDGKEGGFTLPATAYPHLVAGLGGVELLRHIAICVARRVSQALEAQVGACAAESRLCVNATDRDAVLTCTSFAERVAPTVHGPLEVLTGAPLDRGAAKAPPTLMVSLLSRLSRGLDAVRLYPLSTKGFRPVSCATMPALDVARVASMLPYAAAVADVAVDPVPAEGGTGGERLPAEVAAQLRRVPRVYWWKVIGAARATLLTMALAAGVASDVPTVHTLQLQQQQASHRHAARTTRGDGDVTPPQNVGGDGAAGDGGAWCTVDVRLSEWFRAAADDLAVRSRVLLAEAFPDAGASLALSPQAQVQTLTSASPPSATTALPVGLVADPCEGVLRSMPPTALAPALILLDPRVDPLLDGGFAQRLLEELTRLARSAHHAAYASSFAQQDARVENVSFSSLRTNHEASPLSGAAAGSATLNSPLNNASDNTNKDPAQSSGSPLAREHPAAASSSAACVAELALYTGESVRDVLATVAAAALGVSGFAAAGADGAVDAYRPDARLTSAAAAGFLPPLQQSLRRGFAAVFRRPLLSQSRQNVLLRTADRFRATRMGFALDLCVSAVCEQYLVPVPGIFGPSHFAVPLASIVLELFCDETAVAALAARSPSRAAYCVATLLGKDQLALLRDLSLYRGLGPCLFSVGRALLEEPPEPGSAGVHSGGGGGAEEASVDTRAFISPVGFATSAVVQPYRGPPAAATSSNSVEPTSPLTPPNADFRGFPVMELLLELHAAIRLTCHFRAEGDSLGSVVAGLPWPLLARRLKSTMSENVIARTIATTLIQRPSIEVWTEAGALVAGQSVAGVARCLAETGAGAQPLEALVHGAWPAGLHPSYPVLAHGPVPSPILDLAVPLDDAILLSPAAFIAAQDRNLAHVATSVVSIALDHILAASKRTTDASATGAAGQQSSPTRAGHGAMKSSFDAFDEDEVAANTTEMTPEQQLLAAVDAAAVDFGAAAGTMDSASFYATGITQPLKKLSPITCPPDRCPSPTSLRSAHMDSPPGLTTSRRHSRGASPASGTSPAQSYLLPQTRLLVNGGNPMIDPAAGSSAAGGGGGGGGGGTGVLLQQASAKSFSMLIPTVSAGVFRPSFVTVDNGSDSASGGSALSSLAAITKEEAAAWLAFGVLLVGLISERQHHTASAGPSGADGSESLRPSSLMNSVAAPSIAFSVASDSGLASSLNLKQIVAAIEPIRLPPLPPRAALSSATVLGMASSVGSGSGASSTAIATADASFVDPLLHELLLGPGVVSIAQPPSTYAVSVSASAQHSTTNFYSGVYEMSTQSSGSRGANSSVAAGGAIGLLRSTSRGGFSASSTSQMPPRRTSSNAHHGQHHSAAPQEPVAAAVAAIDAAEVWLLLVAPSERRVSIATSAWEQVLAYLRDSRPSELAASLSLRGASDHIVAPSSGDTSASAARSIAAVASEHIATLMQLVSTLASVVARSLGAPFRSSGAHASVPSAMHAALAAATAPGGGRGRVPLVQASKAHIQRVGYALARAATAHVAAMAAAANSTSTVASPLIAVASTGRRPPTWAGGVGGTSDGPGGPASEHCLPLQSFIAFATKAVIDFAAPRQLAVPRAPGSVGTGRTYPFTELRITAAMLFTALMTNDPARDIDAEAKGERNLRHSPGLHPQSVGASTTDGGRGGQSVGPQLPDARVRVDDDSVEDSSFLIPKPPAHAAASPAGPARTPGGKAHPVASDISTSSPHLTIINSERANACVTVGGVPLALGAFIVAKFGQQYPKLNGSGSGTAEASPTQWARMGGQLFRILYLWIGDRAALHDSRCLFKVLRSLTEVDSLSGHLSPAVAVRFADVVDLAVRRFAHVGLPATPVARRAIRTVVQYLADALQSRGRGLPVGHAGLHHHQRHGGDLLRASASGSIFASANHSSRPGHRGGAD